MAMENQITSEECEIIRHALGLNYKRRPYRNHYCDAADAPELAALVAKGLMKAGRIINNGDDRYYHVTSAGAAMVGSKLPANQRKDSQS